MIFAIFQCIIKRIRNSAIFEPRLLLFIGVVSTKTVDVSCKRGEPTAKENSSAASYQLVNHAKEVRVHVLDQMFHVVQEYYIVVIHQRLEKRSIPLVRGNVHCRIGRQLVHTDFIDAVSLKSCHSVLEISPPNVEGVKVWTHTSRFRTLPQCMHDPGRSALNFIHVPNMIYYQW